MNVPNNQSEKRKFSVILVIVGIAVILLFGYAWWQSQSDGDNDAVDNINDSIGDAINNNSTPAGANITNEQREQARILDSKRLADIRIIQSALEEYKKGEKNYPEAIDSLKPDYLEIVPNDPTGAPYVYTGIGSSPYTYYDLSYYLEVGAEGVEAGSHTASPGGIATP